MSKIIAKISIFLCIITIFSLPVYATNWKYLCIDNLGEHLYIDVDSIETIDTNTAIFWMRADNPKGRCISYVHTVLNRATNEYTLTKINIYNLNGQLIGMFNFSEANQNIQQKSLKNKFKAAASDYNNKKVKKLIWPND